jgi:pimeloyl-ACP methyl ester carboxylesterase
MTSKTKIGSASTTDAADSPDGPQSQRMWRIVRKCAGVILVPIAILLGLVATIGFGFVLSKSVNQLVVVAAAALVAGAIASAGGGQVARKVFRSRSKRMISLPVAATLVLAGGSLAVAANESIPTTIKTSAAIKGSKQVKLSTGSTVSVWMIPATGTPKKSVPILFLHGGPGMFTTQSQIDHGTALRARGFDTVYFDQAGSGTSSLLEPKEMTAARAIADVDALRETLQFDRVVLWGQSYGATLASAYTDRYPERVAGLIITSPGPLPGREGLRDYSKTARGSDDGISGRLALTITLMKRNPQLATSLTSQRESGGMFDRVVNRDLVAGAYCGGKAPAAGIVLGGGNLFVNQLVAADFRRMATPAAHRNVPTIVLRGSCDYNDESIAKSYAERFGSSGKVIAIAGAGHGLNEKPAELAKALNTLSV